MGQLLVRFPDGTVHACEQLASWQPFSHHGETLGWCHASRLDADVVAVRRANAPDDIIGATFPNGSALTEMHVLDAFGGAARLTVKPRPQPRAFRAVPFGVGFSDQEVTNLLSQQYRVPTIDLDAYTVADEIVQLLSVELCEKHVVLPVSRVGASLIVAMVDPRDGAALEALSVVTGLKIEPVVATEAAIRAAIGRYYRRDDPQLP